MVRVKGFRTIIILWKPLLPGSWRRPPLATETTSAIGNRKNCTRRLCRSSSNSSIRRRRSRSSRRGMMMYAYHNETSGYGCSRLLHLTLDRNKRLWATKLLANPSQEISGLEWITGNQVVQWIAIQGDPLGVQVIKDREIDIEIVITFDDRIRMPMMWWGMTRGSLKMTIAIVDVKELVILQTTRTIRQTLDQSNQNPSVLDRIWKVLGLDDPNAILLGELLIDPSQYLLVSRGRFESGRVRWPVQMRIVRGGRDGGQRVFLRWTMNGLPRP